VRRGEYAKGRKRRQEILEATLDAFSQLGSRGASMSAIAASAGISPALLQYYFPSRDSLLMAVITQWDIDNDKRGIGMSHFERWLDVTRHNAAIPGLVHLYMTCVAEATDPGHPGRPFYLARYKRITNQITTEIHRLQALGVTPQDAEPERIARALIAGIEGLQIRWLHQPDFDMFDEFVFLLRQFSVIPAEMALPATAIESQDSEERRSADG
jgi:AcrR family transcriptional regulator